ncbi:tRNA (adenosine(37)-N6)-dimethylallyltransferase MiaA [Vaginisenegalia massiliensis]|uniref:tRNA (adenosine(37)-N6)-dimethylallyltransferase MiaA n=1 Tax=Vaginisenegalia massiliensis TaxID=2058294 RepID=UPI000F51CB80|nr:tRNA (adenosine(37)-N6)-dimethylallyltransferase MiaA [Vaginisenegalia massiliensis]
MHNYKHIPLIVIAGPTAVGKTDLSIQLAQAFNGQVINGDSLQVYKGLDIGTGKIREDEKQGVPHHLLDICDPQDQFDASRFKELATERIVSIFQEGSLPFLVGGTGLYLEGLLYDLEFGGQASQNSTWRDYYQEYGQRLGAKALWQLLAEQDPRAASQIPYQNQRRVIRALEVMQETGKLFSQQTSHQNQLSVFDECLIVLNRDREALYQRINQRVELMVEAGLEEEARALYQIAPDQSLTSVKGIGYKEWWPYFEGTSDHQSTVELIQQNSRRYAKRQLTWFRNRMKDVHWIDTTHPAEAFQEAHDLISQHLSKERV